MSSRRLFIWGGGLAAFVLVQVFAPEAAARIAPVWIFVFLLGLWADG